MGYPHNFPHDVVTCNQLRDDAPLRKALVSIARKREKKLQQDFKKWSKRPLSKSVPKLNDIIKEVTTLRRLVESLESFNAP